MSIIDQNKYAAKLGHSEFDFSDEMVSATRGAENVDKVSGTFPEEGKGGFVKFDGENTMYNLSDAGNFMAGKAFSLIGIGLDHLKNGANISSVFTLKGFDTEADQRAIEHGYNYKGVYFTKPKI